MVPLFIYLTFSHSLTRVTVIPIVVGPPIILIVSQRDVRPSGELVGVQDVLDREGYRGPVRRAGQTEPPRQVDGGRFLYTDHVDFVRLGLRLLVAPLFGASGHREHRHSNRLISGLASVAVRFTTLHCPPCGTVDGISVPGRSLVHRNPCTQARGWQASEVFAWRLGPIRQAGPARWAGARVRGEEDPAPDWWRGTRRAPPPAA